MQKSINHENQIRKKLDFISSNPHGTISFIYGCSGSRDGFPVMHVLHAFITSGLALSAWGRSCKGLQQVQPVSTFLLKVTYY